MYALATSLRLRSSSALLKTVDALSDAALSELGDEYLALFAEHAAESRVALPLLRSLVQLLEARLLDRQSRTISGTRWLC